MNLPGAVIEAMAFHQRGELAAAADRYRSFIATASPDSPGIVESLNNLGGIHLDERAPDEAALCFRRAAAILPGFAKLQGNLALARELAGDLAEAEKHQSRIASLEIPDLDHLIRLMLMRRSLGRHREALDACDAAIRLVPADEPLAHERAVILAELGRLDEALALTGSILGRNPGFPEAWNTQGAALESAGRYREAGRSLRTALSIAPSLADAHYNLGNVDRRADHFASAGDRYRRALAMMPLHAQAILNLANVILHAGRTDEALGFYECLAADQPTDASAAWNLGLARLLVGDPRGWTGYARRWEVPGFPSPKRTLRQPAWDGSPIPDRSLFLYSEQGAGDAIQFARFARLAAERVRHVTLEVPSGVARLLRHFHPKVEVVSGPHPISSDYQAPLLDLPRLLGLGMDTAAEEVPYIRAEPALSERWRSRVGTGRFKIGVVWQGNPKQAGEPGRSVPLSAFAPLFGLPGVEIFALQIEHGRDQMKGWPIDDLGAEIRDYADTAAIIDNLDLVISSCTSVVHLAGAMGRPVWVLLRMVPDWRWGLGRGDSAWYPTARLFRQRVPGDWNEVLMRVRGALEEMA